MKELLLERLDALLALIILEKFDEAYLAIDGKQLHSRKKQLINDTISDVSGCAFVQSIEIEDKDVNKYDLSDYISSDIDTRMNYTILTPDGFNKQWKIESIPENDAYGIWCKNEIDEQLNYTIPSPPAGYEWVGEARHSGSCLIITYHLKEKT